MRALVVLMVMITSLDCGGKKTDADVSPDSSHQNVCKWVAWDGKEIECPKTGRLLPQCTAPGRNGCGNFCGCVDPATNHFECTGYPAPPPCPLK